LESNNHNGKIPGEVDMCKPLAKFREAILSDLSKTKVAILMHENPDPDCIGSALGLTKILATWNPEIKCTYIYGGEISHSQNKTLVNVLSIPLVHHSEIDSFETETYDHLICVDVTPERSLDIYTEEPCERKCLMVIDHHRTETERADIVDIRVVGATASIVFDYLLKEEIKFDKNNDDDERVATALLVGIKTDTQDFVSEAVTDLDFEAYRYLIEYVDRTKLSSIINYSYPSYQFELRSQLDIKDNFKMENGIFVGGIGFISPSKRDVLPILAEERSRLEEINTAFVFAIVGDHIEVSIRNISLAIDVNALCQKIFGKQYAGGKLGAGAAKLPLAFFHNPNATQEVKDKQWEFTKSFLIDKIFHIISGNA